MKSKKNEGTIWTIPFIISLAMLVFILLATILAPYIAPWDPELLDLKNVLASPTAEHILGTDKTGRDIFSRILFGGRLTLSGAFAVVAISMVIGIPLGLFAGYYGGKIDRALMMLTNIIISFPPLLLAFVLIAIFGRGFSKVVVALGIIYVPMLARTTRSVVLTQKSRTYVEAAEAMGFGTGRILFSHILPNCMPTILIQVTLDIGNAILDLAAMSFLGLGVEAPQSDWGAMLEDGRVYLLTKPLQALAPGIIIIITVVAINVFVEEIRKYINPSERKLPSYRKLIKRGIIPKEAEQ